MTRLQKLFVIIVGALAVSGCAAAQIALEHKDLVAQTQMSETIFFEPASPESKTVWVETKNTSDKQIDLPNLCDLISQRGYKVISDPNKARYRLQVNILFVGKCDRSALNQSIYAGWGGAMGGFATGLAAGATTYSPRTTAMGGLIGGLLGSAAELIAGSLVKNVTYAMVTDIQISEYSEKLVSSQQISNIKQGAQTVMKQESNEKSHWKLYRVRVGSSANKVNLTFEEAWPLIVSGLEKSISGIF